MEGERMKRNILLIAIIFFILSGIATAEINELSPIEAGDCISISQSCASCSYNNVSSILLPDKTHSYLEASMTQNGAYYNYTYCDTTQEGEYIVFGHGDLDGEDKAWAYIFNSRIRGDDLDTTITPIIFLIAVLLALAVFIFLKVERFTGSFIVFITGIGTLYAIPQEGWTGWIIMACGFIMVIYSLLAKPHRTRFF